MNKTITIGLSAVAVILAGILVWLLVHPGATPSAQPPPSAPPPVSEPTPTPAQAPTREPPSSSPAQSPSEQSTSEQSPIPRHGAGVEDKSAWAPLVEQFGRNFTNTSGGAKAWQARLRANDALTASVRDDLATVAIENVPAGRYDGYTPVETSDTEIAARIDYAQGWAMVVHLISDGTRWQIYAYDLAEE